MYVNYPRPGVSRVERTIGGPRPVTRAPRRRARTPAVSALDVALDLAVLIRGGWIDWASGPDAQLRLGVADGEPEDVNTTDEET